MKPIHTKYRTIGLLGGSFNPAHSGHMHITLYALHRLGFDEVWWLVSPRNPFKSKESLASYAKRLQSAREVAANYPHVRVLDLEAQWNTRYTYETIEVIQKRYPGTHFIWMMGADNLAQFHRWQRWQHILQRVPIVIFDRAPYSYRALRSKTFLRAQKFLLKSMRIPYNYQVPAMHFVYLRRDPASSTMLRKTLGEKAFLRHN